MKRFNAPADDTDLGDNLPPDTEVNSGADSTNTDWGDLNPASLPPAESGVGNVDSFEAQSSDGRGINIQTLAESAPPKTSVPENASRSSASVKCDVRNNTVQSVEWLDIVEKMRVPYHQAQIILLVGSHTPGECDKLQQAKFLLERMIANKF